MIPVASRVKQPQQPVEPPPKKARTEVWIDNPFPLPKCQAPRNVSISVRELGSLFLV
jgi:hypothetical protein